MGRFSRGRIGPGSCLQTPVMKIQWPGALEATRREREELALRRATPTMKFP
jgi:hypothetical protein